MKKLRGELNEFVYTMAFITQRGENVGHTGGAASSSRQRRPAELSELEALVSGVDQVSQSTLLLKKMKEAHEVDDALDYTKEQYERRFAACEERQRAFERKQADMKVQVAKFEKFISENDAKKVRAEAKAKTEQQAYRAKCKEMEKLTGVLARVEEERAAAAAELRRLRKYQRFLETTVEASEDAVEVWDLLNRHQTLRRANADLMGQVTSGEAATERLRSTVAAETGKHTNSVLVRNSDIHASQQKVERLRLGNKAVLGLKEKAESGAKDGVREAGQVTRAIRNLYLRCLVTMHSKVTPVPEATVSTPPSVQLSLLGACLKLVGERVGDLSDVDAAFPAWQHRRRLEERAKLEAAEEEDHAGGPPFGGGGGAQTQRPPSSPPV